MKSFLAFITLFYFADQVLVLSIAELPAPFVACDLQQVILDTFSFLKLCKFTQCCFWNLNWCILFSL